MGRDSAASRRASTTSRLWVRTRPPSATNRSHAAQRPSDSQRARKPAVARRASAADANRATSCSTSRRSTAKPAGPQHGPHPLGLIGEAREAARLPPLVDVKRRERQDAARRQRGAGPGDDCVGHAEVGHHDVRRAERPIVRLLGVGHHEDHVRVARPAGAPPGLDERAGVRVDPDDPPGPRRELKREASGPGADVEDGAARERLGVEPGKQRRRERSIIPAAVRARARAPASDRLSCGRLQSPSILREESRSRCGSRLLSVET